MQCDAVKRRKKVVSYGTLILVLSLGSLWLWTLISAVGVITSMESSLELDRRSLPVMLQPLPKRAPVHGKPNLLGNSMLDFLQHPERNQHGLNVTGSTTKNGVVSLTRMNIASMNRKIRAGKALVHQLVAKYPTCRGKEQLLNLVYTSADYRAQKELTDDLCRKLPLSKDVEKLYGNKPVVHGLETCATYRDMLRTSNQSPMPRIAGMYHTGTNALARSLEDNLQFLKWRSKFTPYNVPWGKHVSAERRLTNSFPTGNNHEDRSFILPIVLIRDPFSWMQSMCEENYEADWENAPLNRCPNLLRSVADKETYNVSVRYHQTYGNLTDQFDSLVDMWLTWNMQYWNASFPRLVIRFEDTIFRLEEVVQIIADCVGMEPLQPFIHRTSPAKYHGNPTDFITALSKYASLQGRHRGLNAPDREYANKVLDTELLRYFGYLPAPLPAPPEDLMGPFEGWWTKPDKTIPLGVVPRGRH